MPKQPIDLMFGAYRRRLLATLLLRPGERFHIRELARMTGISAGSIHRELKTMATSGLLLRERAGNQVLYQANQSCPIYPELSTIFRKTTGLAMLLHKALEPLAGRIDCAFVFGSMASGDEVPSSDVDVIVLGDVTLMEIVKTLSSVNAALGREINPVAMTVNKFADQYLKQDRFAVRVLDEPKIIVMGQEDELRKLIEDRAAGGAHD